jgi:hypothetical protein
MHRDNQLQNNENEGIFLKYVATHKTGIGCSKPPFFRPADPLQRLNLYDRPYWVYYVLFFIENIRVAEPTPSR